MTCELRNIDDRLQSQSYSSGVITAEIETENTFSKSDVKIKCTENTSGETIESWKFSVEVVTVDCSNAYTFDSSLI